MDPLFVWLNVAEACVWWAVAGVVLWRLGRRWWPLAVVLVLFGVSDLVETRTGAWWRPWWLLTWKGGCVSILLATLLRAALAKRTVD